MLPLSLTHPSSIPPSISPLSKKYADDQLKSVKNAFVYCICIEKGTEGSIEAEEKGRI
jgi:hypothetical protein